MSKKNWAQEDKRIRRRRTDWTNVEAEALQKELDKLPDLAEQAETIDLAQPALAQQVEEVAEEPTGATEPN